MVRWNRVLGVTKKDWKGYKKSKELLIPMVLLPMMFAVFLPFVMLIPLILGLPIEGEEAPSWFQRTFPGLTESQAFAVFVSKIMSVPFLLFLPTALSMAMGSDSFAGEKERRTIEQLLATPLSDEELFIGKALACALPSVGVSLLSFGIFSAIVDIVTYDYFGRILLPDATVAVAALITSPLLALFAVGMVVLLSLRVKRVRDAQQLGGLVLLPALGIFLTSMTGLIVLNDRVLLLISAILLAVDLLLIKISSRAFNRDRIISGLG